ncbi:hypothetical protein OEZ86_003566 [Tetradesmus obliquus]|nr:hypothetical protein OEZ86_003566 [Tetradesmus obliquus]
MYERMKGDVAMVQQEAQAFKVVIAPGKTECIAETIESEHFQVPGGPRIEGALFVSPKSPHYIPYVTIRLHSPQGDQMWSQQNVQSEAHFNIAARGPGTYKVCLYNGFESHVDVVVDLVYFTLGHMRRPGQVQVPKGTEENRGKDLANKDHLEDVKRNVMVVGELVDILSGEQKYLHRKLDRHIETVKSNNARTFWYTGLEVLVLLAVTFINLAVTTGFFKGLPVRITV